MRLSLSTSVWNMPEKHILEKFISVGKFLVEFLTTLSIMIRSSRVTTASSSSSLFTLSVSGDTTYLVIHSALLLVSEGHHRIIDALECLFCLWSTVFIRVKLQRSFLVSFLEFSFCRLLLNAKYFVIAAECQDFPAYFSLFRGVRSWSWFFLLPFPWRSCLSRCCSRLSRGGRGTTNLVKALKNGLRFLCFVELNALDKEALGLVKVSLTDSLLGEI